MNKALRALVKPVRNTLHAIGFDVVRYPRDNEGKLAPHLLELFDRLKIECVIDVGAHWGEYGSMLRAWGYEGNIVSFEPVAASVARLQERTADDAAWTVEPAALGSQSGSSEIRVYQASDLASFLELNDYGTDLYNQGPVSYETVAVHRLDEVIAQVKREQDSNRFFLKIDTQGSDLDVLTGATACLSDLLGIQIETSVQPIYDGSTDYLEALEALRNYGFTLTGAFPVSRDPDLRLIELDCVFVRSADTGPALSR
jgi:FkbM family methyltransferase